MSKVYEIVTQRMIRMIEETGKLPWVRPWTNRGMAVNYITQKPYRGINQFLTEPGEEYASYKQIKKAGGSIKKSETKKYTIVTYWLWTKKKGKEDTDEGEEKSGKKFAVPFYYKVWKISQCEGLKSKRKDVETFDHDPIQEAENIKDDFFSQINAPGLGFGPGRAMYVPSIDVINTPPIEDFMDVERYYSTMFHEMAHSTGHATRLNRMGIVQFDKFGSEQYSKEELIAEFTAAMLCGVAGIENKTIEQSVAYVQSWMQRLKEEPKLLMVAAAQAQKASDWIQGISYEAETEETEEEVA